MFDFLKKKIKVVKKPANALLGGLNQHIFEIAKARIGSGYNDRKTLLSLVSDFTAAINTRKQFIHEFNKIRQYYLVDALITNVSEDALTPDATTRDIVSVTSENEKINKELQDLQSKLNFDQIIDDIICDILIVGEHMLRNVIKEGEGLVDVRDDVDQTTIIALYNRGYPEVFFKFDTNNHKFESKDPNQYTHFVLGKNRIRINIDDEFSKNNHGAKAAVRITKKIETEENDLPTYIRVGRPLLYGVLSKIKELMLIESLVPAQKLNQILTGNLVGISVPDNTDPQKAFEISRRYEEILNKRTGVDANKEQLTVSDILEVAGGVKVVPVWGNKGDLRTFNDVKTNSAVDELTSTINDTRSVICSSIGFPPELLFGGDETKAETLKRNARYVRKIKSIQSSVARGLIQMCLAHFGAKGIDVKLSDIQVKFRNEMVNIDELEKLEFSAGVLNSIGEAKRIIDEFILDENPMFKAMPDLEKFQSWASNKLLSLSQDGDFIKPPSKNKAVKKDKEGDEEIL